MIINVAHTKGGVGKTTIAVNLAVELKATMLDLDLQGSSLRFAEIRNEGGIKPNITVFTVTHDPINSSPVLYKEIERCQGSLDNHLVIDSGGMDNNIIREGFFLSDIIITPVGISQVEFYGLQDFDELLQATDKIDRNKTYALLNNINPQAKKNIANARELIDEEFDFKLLNSMLGNRIAYKEAYGEGKSVCELDNKSKAAAEIHGLVRELKTIFSIIDQFL